jgi:hypothetical protein
MGPNYIYEGGVILEKTYISKRLRGRKENSPLHYANDLRNIVALPTQEGEARSRALWG